MSSARDIDNVELAIKMRIPATQGPEGQTKDGEENHECPNCHYPIDNSDAPVKWLSLPVGIKFDPSDQQLLKHLAAKCGVGNAKPDIFIDLFIATIEGDEGICYTHPENLPGAKKDGSSVHFFHKTVNAYATGQRKRRKVHGENGSNENDVRWHKTGRTKPVMENGVLKGFKKIMVLYKSSKKGTKPDKSNWVMHQFHLGTDEDEKLGEYVVSKIFYQQQKQNDCPIEDPDISAVQTSPRTPSTNPANPRRSGRSMMSEDVADDDIMQSSVWKQETIEDSSLVSEPAADAVDDMGYQTWLAGESQAAESNNNPCAAADLENLDLDTPPDFQLSDLQFGSQDSTCSWADRI